MSTGAVVSVDIMEVSVVTVESVEVVVSALLLQDHKTAAAIITIEEKKIFFICCFCGHYIKFYASINQIGSNLPGYY